MNLASTKTRNKPQQQRALLRRQQILETSIEILKAVGIDKFNTALVSQKLNISVGSLYRYFPNKQSILFTLAEQWMQASCHTMDELALLPLESMTLEEFTAAMVQALADTYRQESALSLLLAVLIEVPELREMSDAHDHYEVNVLVKIFKRIHVAETSSERKRLAELVVYSLHYGLVTMLQQGPKLGGYTMMDVQLMLLALFKRYSL